MPKITLAEQYEKYTFYPSNTVWLSYARDIKQLTELFGEENVIFSGHLRCIVRYNPETISRKDILYTIFHHCSPFLEGARFSEKSVKLNWQGAINA